MALINFLKKKKEQIDKAIPDFNIRKRAGNLAKEVVKGTVGEIARTIPIAADTGIRLLEKGEDIVTRPFGKGYQDRLQNLRARQAETEKQLLSKLKPIESKPNQGFRNAIREGFNEAIPDIQNVRKSTSQQRLGSAVNLGTYLTGAKAFTAPAKGLVGLATKYGTLATSGAIGGAAGEATRSQATKKDIATAGVTGAVLGPVLGAAGNVAGRALTKKVVPAISKTIQSTKQAFEQPKFQPGFASTKPKVSIEPKTPKVEAPKIAGFTPAPEAKIKTEVSAKDLLSDRLSAVQNKSTTDFNVQYKQLKKYGNDLTESQAKNLINKYGFDKALNQLSKQSDSPTIKSSFAVANSELVKTQPAVKIKSSSIDTREVPLSSYNKSAQELAREAIAPKVEIPETPKMPKVEQPVVKIATTEPKQPKITAKPQELAQEVMQKTVKEPISPEMPPVARVSQKADVSIPPVQEKTNEYTFEPKRTTERSKRLNYDKIVDVGVKIRNQDEKATLIQNIEKEAQSIANRYTKATGKTFDKMVDEIREKAPDSKAQGLYDELQNLFDVGFEIAKKRYGVEAGRIENYFREITLERLEELLTKGSQKNVGDTLYSPGFTKKRTGVLTEIAKDPRVLTAYFDEAIGPIDGKEVELIKAANSIKNAVKNNGVDLIDGKKVKTAKKELDYVDIFKNNVNPSGSKNEIYSVPKKDYLPSLVRSVYDDIDRNFDDKFKKNFLYVWTDAEKQLNNTVDDIMKMSSKELFANKKYTNKVTAQNDLILNAKKEIYGEAYKKFAQNVANLGNTDVGTLKGVNDIAEEYIGKDLFIRNDFEKALGRIRKAYAQGALGLSVSAAAQNLLEVKKGFAATNIQTFTPALKNVLGGEDLRREFGIQTTSRVLNKQDSQWLKNFDPILFKMFDATESFKDKVLLSTFKLDGQKKGLTGEALTRYVESNFYRYGAKMGGVQDVRLVKGDIARTLLQFSQYPIKDLTAVTDALADKKYGYVAQYALSTVLQGYLLYQTLGAIGFGDQTGFGPLDFYNNIVGGRVFGPAVSTIAMLGEVGKIFAEPEESDRKDENWKKAMAELNRNLMLLVPAGNQLVNKTGKYIQDLNRGYIETKGGDVATPVTDTILGRAKGLVFGRNYDPNKQIYNRELEENKNPSLGKIESQAFRELQKEDKNAAVRFYEGVKKTAQDKRAKNKLEKQAEKLSSIEKPEGMSEQEFLKYKATNEAMLESGLTTTDDLVNYYGRNIKFGQTGSQRTKNEKKVFDLINNLANDDKFTKLSDEQKDAVSDTLLAKSGVKQDVIDYYNKAKKNNTVKYQTALEEIEQNLNKNPNFDVLNYLIEGRRNINGSKLITSGVLDLLKIDGIITDDEAKALKKKNFLYLNGEFVDKSKIKKAKTGKGGKGGKGGKTSKGSKKAVWAVGEKRLKNIPKVKGDIELLKLRSKPKTPVLKLKTNLAKPALKLANNKKSQPKRLTIRNIRVK